MDFFENVKTAVSGAAQTVAKKSGELYEASKTQYAIFELNAEIKKLYAEIGRLTYQTISEEADLADEVKMKCDIITAKLAKINALKNNAEEAVLKCPICGRPADAGDRYCPSCGGNMSVEAETDGEE